MRRWVPWIIALAALLLLYVLRSILPPFIIAVILAYILVPGVDALAARFKVRRVFIVAALYILFLLLLGTLIWSLRPTIDYEVRSLREDSVAVIEKAIVALTGGQQFDVFGTPLDAHTVARAISASLREAFNSPANAFQFAMRVFDAVTNLLLGFIALFYLLLDWEALMTFAFRFIPVPQRERASELTREVHQVLGAYLRGQLILILFVSFITWIALAFVFHLPFAFAIAIATGFLEIIPLVGPVAAGAIAAMAALSVGGANLAVAVIIFYTVLRQVEDQLIAPNILGRAVHVHPLAAIFAVVAGGTIAGPLGLVLGVPAAATVKVILDAVQAPVTPEQLPIGHDDEPEGVPGKEHA